MKSKILFTLAFLLIILAGCRKEELIVEDNDLNARLEAIRSRLTPMEAKFFSIEGASGTARLQFRSEESEALVQDMINQLLAVNADSPFVGDAIDRFGYPSWNNALILSDSSDAGKLIAVPLKKSGTDSTLAILMSAVNDNDSWANFFFPRNAVIDHINGSLTLDTEDQARLKFAASIIIHFDRSLFSKENVHFFEWLRTTSNIVAQDTESTISFRCNGVLEFRYCILIGAAAPLTSKEERKPQVEPMYRAKVLTIPICYMTYVTFNCGNGGAFSGPPGSNIPGWNSSGNSGGSGSQGTPFQVILISICTGANGSNGEISGTGGGNSELSAFCEAFNSILGTFPISDELLRWLYENGTQDLYSQITAYLNSRPDVLGLQALHAYLSLLQSGHSESFNRFISRYRLVYGQLVPALELNENEAAFVLLSGNGALANEIWQFLQEDQATQDAQEIQAGFIAANILIDLHMANRENGPIDQTYTNVLTPYTLHFSEEALEECCTGSSINDAIRAAILAAEEAIFLKQAHPEWSDNKIRWHAFKSVIIGRVHTALDIIGLFPGLGEPADLLNGVLYTVEGDGVNAALSFGATLPLVGWVSTGAKYATILYKAGSKTYRMKNYVDAAGQITFSHSGKLRAILSTGPAATDLRQAHHIVPEEFWNHPIVQKAASSRDGSKVFHMNAHHNGVPVPNTRHNGSHPAYSQKIEDELTRWDLAFPNATPDQAAQRLRQWQQALKNQIENSTQHINDIIPPQIPPL